ncbi:hypothetical protein [Mangrovihabitans endophyticus]|uniref:Uncharacterized protein n=1 Tax=Mangrovihabitans endophyticus TaxID=1751298 RepID=A0A8J3C1J3_9ACTN|nr:hypothetical protein [Mangrovihabitans endophyticus]GGK96668.1 hypothetical protein GCM10012284_33630 [Mangrovihabitans endophyticus]
MPLTMTDAGWPLIPREVLPAPVEAVRPARRRPDPVVDGGRQLPFFGAETTEPAPADLVGLLAGPGRLERMGGTARVSVMVDAAWRVHVLVSELVGRGLVVNWAPVPGEGAETPGPAGFRVRTAYSSRLSGLAHGWPPGGGGRLFLSGPRLRLWVAAAGEPVPDGYALRLDPDGGAEIAHAALVEVGLGGTVSDTGPAYLISGRKRLALLAEMVGERPETAPAAMWPGAAAA